MIRALWHAATGYSHPFSPHVDEAGPACRKPLHVCIGLVADNIATLCSGQGAVPDSWRQLSHQLRHSHQLCVLSVGEGGLEHWCAPTVEAGPSDVLLA